MKRDLRDYQERDVIALMNAFRRHRRICYVLPTGGGKTAVAVRLIQYHVGDTTPVLVLVHRRELADQMVAQLVADGLDIKQIGVMRGNDPRANANATIQVASIQTLSRRCRPDRSFGLIVVDEAHHAVAKSYRAVLDAYPNANILGLTATPLRLDGRGIGDIFDEIVHGPVFSVLWANGHLAIPRVFSREGNPLEGVRMLVNNGDYDKRRLAEVMNTQTIVGNAVEHWQRLAAGRPTIAFGVDVSHSKRIASMFNAACVPAEHVDGSTRARDRAATLARLLSGETKVVTNCELFGEGWDAPQVKAVIQLRPTRSAVIYNQQAGRALRPFQSQHGQHTPIVQDHAGNWLRHGLPHTDRTFDLVLSRGKKAPTHVMCKQCGNRTCGAIMPLGARLCDACGFEFPAPTPMVEEEGVLVEVNKKEEEYRRTEWERLKSEAVRRQWPQEMIEAVWAIRFPSAHIGEIA